MPNYARDQDIGQYTDDMTIAAAVAILLAAINAVATAIASLSVTNVDTGESILAALEEGRDWDWEMTSLLIDKLDAVRLAAVAAGVNTVTELQTFHAEFATLGAIITAQTTGLTSELQELQTAVIDKGDDIVAEFEVSRDWSMEMTSLLIDKMETIRAANVAIGTDLGARLAALHTLTQLASDLGIAQGANILAELQAVGVTAEAIDYVLDASLEELKILRLATEAVSGEDMKKGD